MSFSMDLLLYPSCTQSSVGSSQWESGLRIKKQISERNTWGSQYIIMFLIAGGPEEIVLWPFWWLKESKGEFEKHGLKKY